MITLPAGIRETDGRTYVIDAQGIAICEAAHLHAEEIARALNASIPTPKPDTIMSTESPKHTTNPWVQRPLGNFGDVNITDENGYPIAFTGVSTKIRPKEEAEANAALIVLAVNHHTKLVNALTEARDDIRSMGKSADLVHEISTLLATLNTPTE